MFHCACALIDQSLLKMMYSSSIKNRRNNYSSDDVDKAITKIQTGDVSQAKVVCKYGIQRRTLAGKCKNKVENVAENIPGSLTVMVNAAETFLVQWYCVMHKQGLPVVQEMIIHSASEIHCYMFVFMRSVVLVVWVWCY